MKRKLIGATVVCILTFAISCQKENPLTSTALNASSEDDMYTETLSMVQTPVSHNINANIGGYLEALPAHYANHRFKRYPVIIFLHGVGELGTGSESQLMELTNNSIPKLINKKTFPTNFRVNDTTFQFIVISPQFKAWPQPSDVNDMINYVIKNYRVDTTRMYLCGQSMGGGVVWDYAYTYGKRITGIVPICGASWPTTEKAESIADDNIAVWALHNQDDPTVPSWYTVDYVEYINDDKPAKVAKKTIWQTSGHDAWTKATDPNYKENGKNIYEWMLSHKKNPSK